MKQDKTLVTDFLVPGILVARREQLGMSLADIEIATKIRGKYLAALEAGDYASLPNDIYARGFVHKYAEHIGLDANDVAAQYMAERGGVLDAPVTRAPRLSRPKFVITTRVLVVFGLVLAAAAVIAYLSVQFNALSAPPKLELTSPNADQVVYGTNLDITGRVGGGADVFVNDSPILTDANGSFSNQLSLSEGVNTVTVKATNKLGKSTTVTRNILAKLPLADATNSLPVAIFDGVAMKLKITKQATAIKVMVDGVEKFNGTMQAGTTQVFKGTASIKLDTANAGATEVTVTNAVAASKSLGVLGRDGESKKGLEFAKDTVFQ